jgi:phenylalanyl-tRNA synthetase beta chain
MNIRILDSSLRRHVETVAKPEKISEILSLTSASVEKLEKIGNDWSYDIEVTTNRPDMMSVTGIARETAAALDANGITARFVPLVCSDPKQEKVANVHPSFSVVNDDKLVSRVCAVVIDVAMKKELSPAITKELENAGMRSLNNIIDITNYVMLLTGHPTHVFDFDRLHTDKLIIRESKKGEKITTLDGKTYALPGSDIIAIDATGRIVDLLGIMGLENSVVTDQTKRILFFIDNVDQHRIRKTSMTLGIRTDAAQLNEKGLDTELSYEAFSYGIQLFKQYADGKLVSPITDIYPHPYRPETVSVTAERIRNIVGIEISLEKSATMLQHLGFGTKIKDMTLTAMIPANRAKDIAIPEDLIEEIARIYGYHNIPSQLTPLADSTTAHLIDNFYWEKRVKEAMKYWGFTEVYTYSMVNETMFEGDIGNAVKIKNPLNDEMIYMRRSLVPSLLSAAGENKTHEQIKIFEISNVYHKRSNDLPDERVHFAGVIKKPGLSFFELKGIFEQLMSDLGITKLSFRPVYDGSSGAEMLIHDKAFGMIEILDKNTIDFECNFSVLTDFATVKKTFTPLAKYPAIIEDMTFVIPDEVTIGSLELLIKQQSDLIKNMILLDKYQNTRTFRIYYQHADKNLTGEDITPIRMKIARILEQKLHVTVK